ncbi:hypothetical protein KKF84_08405 [Myxococcota bacterium]|nr:hypothetical protein [Myxococcota bacterium]MBU1535330.1 hypothetical protein [Myxococcota bacterium]
MKFIFPFVLSIMVFGCTNKDKENNKETEKDLYQTKRADDKDTITDDYLYEIAKNSLMGKKWPISKLTEKKVIDENGKVYRIVTIDYTDAFFSFTNCKRVKYHDGSMICANRLRIEFDKNIPELLKYLPIFQQKGYRILGYSKLYKDIGLDVRTTDLEGLEQTYEELKKVFTGVNIDIIMKPFGSSRTSGS